jgi:phosphate transport system permease protein
VTDTLIRTSAAAGDQPAVPSAPPATIVPERAPGGPAQRPRKVRSLIAGVYNTVGAAVTALCVSMLLFGKLAAFSGLIGFVIVTYGVFLLTYGVLVSLTDDRQAVVDRLMTMVLWSAVLVLGTALLFIVVYTVWSGRKAIVHVNFYTQDLTRAGPLAPLTVGGIKHAIVGTLWMISISMALTVPLGLVCAVFLNEVGGRLARFVRTIVEAMTALPSIVAGLFIFASFVLVFHEKTAFAASLALSVDMLPIIIRAADVVLRLVPGNLRRVAHGPLRSGHRRNPGHGPRPW